MTMDGGKNAYKDLKKKTRDMLKESYEHIKSRFQLLLKLYCVNSAQVYRKMIPMLLIFPFGSKRKWNF